MGFSIFMHDLILCIICEPILCAGEKINIIIIIINFKLNVSSIIHDDRFSILLIRRYMVLADLNIFGPKNHIPPPTPRTKSPFLRDVDFLLQTFAYNSQLEFILPVYFPIFLRSFPSFVFFKFSRFFVPFFPPPLHRPYIFRSEGTVDVFGLIKL
jgi:hypothetical protein